MIKEKTLKERSLLFAKLAELAYNDDATKQAKKLGFTTIEFYNKGGAQAWRFQNKTDLVIACRGTEPTAFNDIKADLRAIPVMAETVSRVHKGFKTEVDDIWPMVQEDIIRKTNVTKDLWICGHSLGAAMATIMANRAECNIDLNNPIELHTFGSPRVGWPTYVKSFCTKHYRWVNNNDIVTRVPLRIMGFRHCGQEHYINAYGNLRPLTAWQRIKDQYRGMWMGIKKGKIDNFSDHSMSEYVKHIENWEG